MLNDEYSLRHKVRRGQNKSEWDNTSGAHNVCELHCTQGIYMLVSLINALSMILTHSDAFLSINYDFR